MSETIDQIAALPLRVDRHGKLKVLLVTSRATRRWILPKGGVMAHAKPHRAAEIEALEEARAKGQVGTRSIGEFYYDKVLGDGSVMPCRVLVYPMQVEVLKGNWKEREERERRWFSPRAAARRVAEPKLKELLLSLTEEPWTIGALKKLLKS